MNKVLPEFTKLLMKWYRDNARDLPWRHTKDPYKIWMSEIMLQQTTVATVIPYWNKWVKKFPTIDHVARAKETTILKMWQGLGYYNRARNIHKAAKLIVKEFNSEVPKDPAVLLTLPGFGSYTVGAVLSIAHDQRLPIIDANVRRVIMRIYAIKGLADAKQDNIIFPYLQELLPYKRLDIFNQALMELGALICPSQSPQCLRCPVRSLCKAYEQGIQEVIPETKKKVIKDIYASIAVIENKGKYFIQQRTGKGLLSGLWEFPGGKIEGSETPERALIREVREEIDVVVEETEFLMKVKHYYTQFRVNLNVYACKVKSLPKEDSTHKWVNLKKLTQFPMPSGSVKIVDKLLKM
ncbi:MAG: A/G-specific adenine glycosylase [Candidatus Omnitrophota bacterium]|jgi:A/G-specific adenine glycosylase